jgi:hypothetical protein
MKYSTNTLQTPLHFKSELANNKSRVPNFSSLGVAVGANNLEVVKFLVEHGANVNFNEQYARLPLLIAIQNLNQEIFDYLSPLTNLELRNQAELSALFSAVGDSDIEILRFLVQIGCNFNRKDC